MSVAGMLFRCAGSTIEMNGWMKWVHGCGPFCRLLQDALAAAAAGSVGLSGGGQAGIIRGR